MAANDLNLILSEDDSESQFIQVPINKKDFGDFITGLLGQPETIHARRNGSFSVDHNRLINLHNMIDQRIKLQAKASLVDFSAKFSYHNAPDRTLTTAKGFVHFNETRITTTKSVTLTWTYLVFFPDKPSPEKQEIFVKFIADPSIFITDSETTFNFISEHSGGAAIFTVSHTERTWGDDISALLTREINETFKTKSFFSKHEETIKATLVFFIIMTGIFLPDYIEELIRDKEAASIFLNALPNGTPFASLNIENKLNVVITLLQPSNQLHTIGTGYKILSIVCSMGISLAILLGLGTTQRSHILITKKDIEAKEAHEKKEQFKLLKTIASVLTAIAIGVGGNYAYYLLHLPS